MKLCVFPNDPIRSYYEKGEIKERYFNPNNIFDEIHVISFIDNDIQENKIQNIAGNAKLKIHSIGKIKIQNRKKYLKSIIELVREIDPDAIRTYNSRLEGWFAANCAKSLSKPLFVSIHTQYDHNRQLLKKSNFKKFLISKFMETHIISTKSHPPHFFLTSTKNEMLSCFPPLSSFKNDVKIASSLFFNFT